MLGAECSPIRRQLVRLYQWGIFIFFVCLLPIVAFFLLSNVLFSIVLFCYSAACLIFICIFHSRSVEYSKRTRELIRKSPVPKKDQEYHAIIIAHRNKTDDKGGYQDADYYDGIDILINFFPEQNPPIPFVVDEVTTKGEAISAICNSNAQYLWIFGHGQRNILGLREDVLCYKELPPTLRKKFVGQYHCNSPFGTSLAKQTNAPESDVTIFPRFTPFTRRAVERKVRDLKKRNVI